MCSKIFYKFPYNFLFDCLRVYCLISIYLTNFLVFFCWLLVFFFFYMLWLEDTWYDFRLLKIKTFCGLTYSLVTYSLLWRLFLGSLRKVCFLLLLHEEFCMDVLGAVSLLCCSRLLLLIFCLVFLCITESRILKYSLIVESFIPSVLSMVASYILNFCYLIHMFIINMFYFIY